MSSDETLVVTTAQEDEEFLFAFKQTMISSVPMILKATIELGILKHLSESPAQLSPAQIASGLSIKNPEAAVTIDRILRLLASLSFLSCTLIQDKAGRPERVYGLGPRSKHFVSEEGASLAPWLLFLFDKVSLSGWFHLKDAVIQGEGDPFKLANGAIIFDYTGTDPKLNDYFNNAMKCASTIYMGKVMDSYRGFEGAKTVVDIGGGVGECTKLILSKHPHLRGINFDLPYVVKNGLSYPGLEHVGGSFVNDPLPKGDILVLKWQLHSFGDEFGLQLLKSCCDALPASGKVVLIDQVSPEYPGTNLLTRSTFTSDMVMLGMTPGGKDRTMKEFEVLARAAGFSSLKVACRVFNMWVLEIFKTA
ncbi:flavone 3'-O-methyltransferase 1-like [Rhodamnia argentea]|uniref:Flavone 3'-O-methyltransferase 1-like n=1 Tax=Rhodamnia argentea TaxID=178133 RepID=A0A8B8PP87_9MYRT|nr:flavone 3'-O-methyltransferase 1-like [Rhodamnia argentea]